MDSWNKEATAKPSDRGCTDKELPSRPVTATEETSGHKKNHAKVNEESSEGEAHSHSSEDHQAVSSSPLCGPYTHSIPKRDSLQNLKLHAVDHGQSENSYHLNQFYDTISTSVQRLFSGRSFGNSVSCHETKSPELADYMERFSAEDRRHIRDFQSWQTAVCTTVSNEKRKQDQALLGNTPEGERNGMEVRFGLKYENGEIKRMSWVSPW